MNPQSPELARKNAITAIALALFAAAMLVLFIVMLSHRT